MARPAITTLPEKHQTVLKYWKAGKTSSAIAVLMGITRGSVMGIISRLRLRGFVDYKIPPRPPKPFGAPIERISRARKRPEIKKVKLPDTPPVPSDILGKSINAFLFNAVTPPKKAGKSVPFSQLGRRMCRYSTSGNHVSEYLFCGDPVVSPYSYCEEHLKLCVHFVYSAKGKKNEFWRKKNKF